MVRTDKKEEFNDEEPLDPRIKHELERLNLSVDRINELENTISATQSNLLSHYHESHSRLSKLAAKLGKCIERSKPYYGARIQSKEAHERLERATTDHERAVSVLTTAREIVDVAEQELCQKKALSPAWQEMLNAANEKVSEAEKELVMCSSSLNTAERQHREAQALVKKEYKLSKKSIHKSKSYYEAMAKYNGVLESHQEFLKKKRSELKAAKESYSQSLSNLEKISEDIHNRRQQRANDSQTRVSEHETTTSTSIGEDNSADLSVSAGIEMTNELVDVELDCDFNGILTESDILSESDDSLSSLDGEASRIVRTAGVRQRKEKQMLRERSRSYAATQSEKHLPAEKFFERCTSLPHVLEDTGPSGLRNYQLSDSSSSDSSVSVLDDSCLCDAVSYQNFDALSICPEEEGNKTEVKFDASDNKYDTLPSNLKRYQRQFTLYRSHSTLKPRGDNNKSSLSSRVAMLDLTVTAEFEI